MASKPGDDIPPAGILCARCGCADLRVVTTVRLQGGRIRRYRECRHCHRRLVTLEVPPSQLKNPYQQ